MIEPTKEQRRRLEGAINPAATMVEVRRLVNPDHLVEIEVVAVVSET